MNEILQEFLTNYGLSEIDGPLSNPQIMSFFEEIGFNWVTDDSTAWCSAALNFFCKRHGYERSGALDARSWLKVGELILEPQLGDIVVFWRGSYIGWQGHVGLFINKNIKYVFTLGGNQGNSISIAPYSIDKVLGYRRLHKLQ